jgi:hypothetical protein
MPFTKAATWAEAPEARASVTGTVQNILRQMKKQTFQRQNRNGIGEQKKVGLRIGLMLKGSMDRRDSHILI